MLAQVRFDEGWQISLAIMPFDRLRKRTALSLCDGLPCRRHVADGRITIIWVLRHGSANERLTANWQIGLDGENVGYGFIDMFVSQAQGRVGIPLRRAEAR